MDFINFVFLCFFATLFEKCRGDVEFCHSEGLHFITSNQSENENDAIYCPNGLIFKESTKISAISSSNLSKFCIKESICSDEWICENAMEEITVQILVIMEIQNETGQSLRRQFPEKSNFYRKCKASFEVEPLRGVDSNFLAFRKKRSAVPPSGATEGMDDGDSYVEPPEELIAQTKRMFYFLANLNPESVKSPLRAAALLEKSVELVNTICDPNFLNPWFMKEALRAFFFLLKEQGTERVSDVGDEDFLILTQALDACATTPNPLTLDGIICPPQIKADVINRMVNGEVRTIPYEPSSFSFVWGKYDIVIDVMWYTINIVHGMCFATFRQNINVHHKYQVAMEELFKHDILFRWTKPLKLYREYEYDHIFLAPVNESMQVLDACTIGAYISSPFRHRLNRPVSLQRKRRSILTPLEIQKHRRDDVMALCLQSETERDHALQNLQRRHC